MKKKAKKILRIVLGVIVVLIVCVVIFVHLFGNSLLRTGIESAASKTLGVGVTLEGIDISILGGSVSLQNLVVDNPPGYQHEKLLEVGSARIDVSIGSLLKDTVNIEEIMFDGVNVVIEQKGITSNNLQDVINSIPKSEAEEKPDAGEKPGKPAKKLHIDKLELKNITVKADLIPIPGKATTVTLKLDPIVMTDLGSDDKMDVAKLSSKILLAIAAGVAKQGAGILPEGMTDALDAALSGVAEIGKVVGEEGIKLLEGGAEGGKKLLEGGAEAGKGIIDGFKGLLKPKKEE